MADRRHDTILLLASRLDGVYLPRGALRTSPGFVPGRLEPCGDCEGTGKARDRFGRRSPCARCAGRGRLAFDAMDALHVPVGSEATVATARPRQRKTCDRCNGSGVWKGDRCELCKGEGKRDVHVFELHVDDREYGDADPVDAAIDRRSAAGSYAELDRAVNELRAHDRVAWWVLLTAVDSPSRAGLELVTAQTALTFVVERMPDPVRVPSAVRANAKLVAERRTRAKGRGSDPRALAQRAKEMRRHGQDGRSPQWIAAEYGVAVSTVYETLNGGRA